MPGKTRIEPLWAFGEWQSLGSDDADHEWEESRGKVCGVRREDLVPCTLSSWAWGASLGRSAVEKRCLPLIAEAWVPCTVPLCIHGVLSTGRWEQSCGQGAELPVGEGLRGLSCPGFLPSLANYRPLLPDPGEAIKLLHPSFPPFLNLSFLLKFKD